MCIPSVCVYRAYIPVIVLTHLSHGYESSGVFIGFEWVDVVQRRRVFGVAIAAGEVNAYCEVDLTASHYVIQEGVGFGYLCVMWGKERLGHDGI